MTGWRSLPGGFIDKRLALQHCPKVFLRFSPNHFWNLVPRMGGVRGLKKQTWKREDPPHLGGPGLGHTHAGASVSRHPLSNTDSLADFKCLLDLPWIFQTPPTCGLSTCYLFCLECSSGLTTLSSLRSLQNASSPTWPHHLKLTLLSNTFYLFFSPSFFLGDSSPYGIWSIFSFIWLIIFPPTRIFTPRGQRFLPFCSLLYSQCLNIA